MEISVSGISYRSMNGWYISISSKKAISVNLYFLAQSAGELWSCKVIEIVWLLQVLKAKPTRQQRCNWTFNNAILKQARMPQQKCLKIIKTFWKTWKNWEKGIFSLLVTILKFEQKNKFASVRFMIRKMTISLVKSEMYIAVTCSFFLIFN